MAGWLLHPRIFIGHCAPLYRMYCITTNADPKREKKKRGRLVGWSVLPLMPLISGGGTEDPRIRLSISLSLSLSFLELLAVRVYPLLTILITYSRHPTPNSSRVYTLSLSSQKKKKKKKIGCSILLSIVSYPVPRSSYSKHIRRRRSSTTPLTDRHT